MPNDAAWSVAAIVLAASKHALARFSAEADCERRLRACLTWMKWVVMHDVVRG